ncbi:MAG TPA: ABC transporter ATP-binding protein [Steroidobacteraceae bacterium]|jgi:ABC-2 type transport system ATP-binding protein
MPAVIETRDLAKSYGRFGALQGLDLSMPQGSIFALVGASGAGKTTAIRVLLNILTPTRGRATVLGVDSRAIGPEVLARIGYVSESQLLPPRLRVGELFDFLRPCYRSWDGALEAEFRERLRLPAERRIQALSHGMRLKMALACALAFRPQLLILDEPFSGLDALTRDEMIGVFLREPRESSILISSHELDEVERLATHVAFLDEGRLLFQGTLDALRESARAPDSGSLGEDGRPLSLRTIFVGMVSAARRGQS